MVWVKLDDDFGNDAAGAWSAQRGHPDPKLSDAAFRTHVEALGWAMRRLNRGHIAKRDLYRFAEVDDPDAAVAELVDKCWWEPYFSGNGWQIVQSMAAQRTPEQVAMDRDGSAERQRRWRERHANPDPDRNGVTNGVGNGAHNADPVPVPVPVPTETPNGVSVARHPKPESAAGERQERADVARLCAQLADRMEANGCKRPTITQDWRDAARLLLDRDGRTEEQVGKAIDWCQDDEFWRSNIHSMPKLRKQYETLRLQAQRGHESSPNGTRPSTATQRAQQAIDAGQEVQAMIDRGELP